MLGGGCLLSGLELLSSLTAAACLGSAWPSCNQPQIRAAASVLGLDGKLLENGSNGIWVGGHGPGQAHGRLDADLAIALHMCIESTGKLTAEESGPQRSTH